MRALVCEALSDDLSGVAVREVAQPAPGPGEALVRVRAASVNFPDMLMCQGKYQFRPDPPFTPGMDMAGEVVALGEGAEGPAIGAAVYGGARLGAFADYALAQASALQPKPAALSFEEAAAFPAASLTAYVALVRRGALQRGEWLLVHGAAGGVGYAAVQLGLHLGARVIATASSAEKRAFLADKGVAHVLPATGFREAVKEITGGAGADVIYDPVGGDVFDESVRCIAFGGRLLVIGFAGGRIASVSTNMPLIKGFSVVGVRAGEYGRRDPVKGKENLSAIAALAEAGALKPHIGARFSLEQARDALVHIQGRRAIGKIVVTP
ncbi:MAG: NADPH:quinone oxidoreductase family protein [Hydrogenophilaceae bacterium]|jgi:NADPH2:quinone reductase|nr:NADPH:quinone oxidoreductase family protein [Hydrogenophilaceae bacterium]